MKFDIVLSFVLQNSSRVTGYMTSEPVEITREEAIQQRDALQSQISTIKNLTLFTRGFELILPGKNPTPSEVTLPGALLQQCLMFSQVIEVEDSE